MPTLEELRQQVADAGYTVAYLEGAAATPRKEHYGDKDKPARTGVIFARMIKGSTAAPIKFPFVELPPVKAGEKYQAYWVDEGTEAKLAAMAAAQGADQFATDVEAFLEAAPRILRADATRRWGTEDDPRLRATVIVEDDQGNLSEKDVIFDRADDGKIRFRLIQPKAEAVTP